MTRNSSIQRIVYFLAKDLTILMKLRFYAAYSLYHWFYNMCIFSQSLEILEYSYSHWIYIKLPYLLYSTTYLR